MNHNHCKFVHPNCLLMHNCSELCPDILNFDADIKEYYLRRITSHTMFEQFNCFVQDMKAHKQCVYCGSSDFNGHFTTVDSNVLKIKGMNYSLQALDRNVHTNLIFLCNNCQVLYIMRFYKGEKKHSHEQLYLYFEDQSKSSRISNIKKPMTIDMVVRHIEFIVDAWRNYNESCK